MTSPAEFQRRFQRTDADNTTAFQKSMDAHRAQAEQIRQRAEQQLDRIGQRKDLTPDAKRTAAARVYKPAAEQIQALLDQHIAKVNAHKQDLARKAFGSGKAADPQTAMAQRHARQQAATIDDPGAAEQMIREAQFDGDEQLARAVAGVAFERGWHSAVDVWNADGRNDAYMRHAIELMEMPDTNSAVWRIETAASYAQPTPGLLDGLKPHEISRAAESEVSVYGDGPEAA